MKKIYYLLLLALFGVAGCNNDDYSEFDFNSPEILMSELNTFIAENRDFNGEDIPELLCGDKSWYRNSTVFYTDDSLTEIWCITELNTLFKEKRYPPQDIDDIGTYLFGHEFHPEVGDVFQKDGKMLNYFPFINGITDIFTSGLTGHYEMNLEFDIENKRYIWSGVIDTDYKIFYDTHHLHNEYYVEVEILALTADRMVTLQKMGGEGDGMHGFNSKATTNTKYSITEYIAMPGIKLVEPGHDYESVKERVDWLFENSKE